MKFRGGFLHHSCSYINKLIRNVSIRCPSRLDPARVSLRRVARSEVLSGKKRGRGRKARVVPRGVAQLNVRWKTAPGHGTVTCTVKERATTNGRAGPRESVAPPPSSSSSFPGLFPLRPFTLSREILIGPRRCVPRLARAACA